MHLERALEGEQSGINLDAWWMSYSTSACFDFVGYKTRRSTRKAIPLNFLGSGAVACLLLGCAWIVYANIIRADVYPELGSANYNAPVIRRSPVLARSVPLSDVVAAISEPAPLISAPEMILPQDPSLSFDDRFTAAAPQAVAPRQVIARKSKLEAPKLVEVPKPKQAVIAPVQVAAIPVQPSRPVETRPAKGPAVSIHDMAQRARAVVMSIATNEKRTIFEKLWGKQPSQGSLLSYASADASITASIGQKQNPALGGSAPYDRSTAVYDISARTVYLPDGTKLEAHSGLGSRLDDPHSAHIRMQGVTPPHIYELTPREALFHGVPALRLTPIGGEGAIFGRTGLLAHTYMLGPNGDSNGCVSFRDYSAFLNAYRNQGIKRLAVVARVE